MIEPSQLLTGGGLCAAALYVLRLNYLRAGTHLPRCIAVQGVGLIVASWVLGSTPGAPLWLQLVNGALLLLLTGHLVMTDAQWGRGAPAEAETRPMPLDGATQ